MGKKSRRQRVPNAASRRGPTPGRSEDDVQSQPARNEPSSQPKLTVAEADMIRSCGDEFAGMDILKKIKRWPRLRKYWPRLRRRVCWGCGKQYDLSEPRLWVCGGCGEARYCDVTCQGAHWPAHKGPCWQKIDERIEKRLSEGASPAEIAREAARTEWPAK